MKLRSFGCRWLTAAVLCTGVARADDPPAAPLAEMAKRYDHFSREQIIYNRAVSTGPGFFTGGARNGSATTRTTDVTVLANAQERLLQELQAASGDHAGLEAALKDADPKVRTLALGALFQREDGRDLPLIASLIDDTAPTFPDLHESMNSTPRTPPLSEMEDPQTVAHVARAMLGLYGVKADLPREDGKYFDKARAAFNAYWPQYAGQTEAASWFVARLKRATRQTTPIMARYRPDIDRVLADLRALPESRRAWTQLYVLGTWNRFPDRNSGLVVSEEELIQIAKTLRPEALLRFLQGESVCDDPDLNAQACRQLPWPHIENFILLHADRLLRPEDADALLALAKAPAKEGLVRIECLVAAALVQPARAREILEPEIARSKTATLQGDAGLAAEYLARIDGAQGLPAMVEWFYGPGATPNVTGSQGSSFLEGLVAAPVARTQAVLAALVKDPRFERANWEALKGMLDVANAARATPLVSVSEIYGERPASSHGLVHVTLARWRNLLRQEYGASPGPLPEGTIPTPKHILTRPMWARPLDDAPIQSAVSPDGTRLATLTWGVPSVFDAATGRFLWQPPHLSAAEAHQLDDRDPRVWPSAYVAFGADSQHLIGCTYRFFHTWEIPANLPPGASPAKGWSGPGLENGTRVVCAGPYAVRQDQRGVECYEVAGGKSRWKREDMNDDRPVLAIAPDGGAVAVVPSQDTRTVEILDAATGETRQRLDRLVGYITSLSFAADGHSVLTVSEEDGVQRWDARTGELRRSYPYPTTGDREDHPAFSPDGRWLAVVGASQEINGMRIGVFGVESGELEWEIHGKREPAEREPAALVFSPDGGVLYAGRQAWRLEAGAK